jgi:hypothetical protein
MSKILKAVEELIEKAQGYKQHTGSGGEAEAVSHSIPTVEPGADEKKKESNEANSGTHPESGGAAGKKTRAGGGEDFVDGGPEEDTIETPKGSGGRAPVARPQTIAHEGGGTGPNHPGTATSTQKQQKSEGDPDLTKSEDEEEVEKAKESDSKEEKEDDDDKDDEESEKSSESDEIILDVDQFAKDIAADVETKLDEKYAKYFEDAIQKSNESEYIEAGLAKSIASTLDRVEEVEKALKETEKAIVNIANALNIRKSLLKSADNIKGIDNPSLSKTELSKSEISSRLLDMQMAGNQGVDSAMVLRFDAVGDPSTLPEHIRQKLGI